MHYRIVNFLAVITAVNEPALTGRLKILGVFPGGDCPRYKLSAGIG